MYNQAKGDSGMNAIRMIILEADPTLLRALESFFSVKKDIRVIAALRSGKEGLRRIRRERPDVVLLDLVLTDLDGYSVLLGMRRLTRPPLSIVCTEFYTEAALKISRKYGAAYFLCRPIALDCLYRAVVDCFHFSDASASLGGDDDLLPPTVSAPEIRRALTGIGIAPTLSGCQYLTDALLLLHSSPERIENLTHFIYAEVASRNRVSLASVERCIRKAIGAAFLSGGNAFPFDHCPSNKEFLHFMASWSWAVWRC